MSNLDNNNKQTTTGPQGTQVFEIDEINRLLAEKIAASQSDDVNVAAFVGLSSSVEGQQFVLNKDKLDVGRRPSSDLVLNEPSVSAMHAQIIKRDNQWKVLNLLSSNGTFVNGEKVAEKILKAGDRISFAGVEFVFTYIDDPEGNQKSYGNLSLILISLGLISAFAAIFYFLL